METKLFVATKAIIRNKEGKILILRERASVDSTQTGIYTIPGGRIHPDESYRDGLMREVWEECGLVIETREIVAIGEWWPTPRGESWHVVALFFACDTHEEPVVVLSEEHDMFAWIDPVEYKKSGLVETEHHVIEKYLQYKK